MRDENCLRRQWALLRSLTSRHLGLTIRQMAEDVGVTQRTIRRDLDVFRSVGFPLDETVGEFGRKTWTIKAARDHPPLAFTYDEAIALYLGRRMLEPLVGTPFGEAAEDAFRKIRAALGPGALDYLIQWRVANYFNSQRGRRSRQPRPAQIANFDFSHIESGLAQPDQIASDRELIAKIHSELAEMTPDWAEAVRSRYGFPGVPALTEIARKKGKSRQSVEKHARKGLRELKIAIT